MTFLKKSWEIYNMMAFIAKMHMPWASHEVLGLVTRHERAMEGLQSGVEDAKDQEDMAKGEMAMRSVLWDGKERRRAQMVVPGLGHDSGKGAEGRTE
jgi:hypothetical protein